MAKRKQKMTAWRRARATALKIFPDNKYDLPTNAEDMRLYIMIGYGHGDRAAQAAARRAKSPAPKGASKR